MTTEFKIDNLVYIDTNEDGYEFHLSKTLTKYAEDNGLKDTQVMYVKKEGEKNFETILLVKDREPIFEARRIDAIATRIDIMKILEEF